MTGALEKEIRLSFASRIRGTLPAPYRPLISETKEEDSPPFKYDTDTTPYSPQGKEVLRLLRTKAADSTLNTPLTTIENLASEHGVIDPLIPSTDAFVTAICHLGAKSLSHVLSQIEARRERLTAIGPVSEPARRQIITSVMDYWHEKPGVGVNIIDKLLNYTILTPQSVILWALGDVLGRGESLTQAHIYEMVASTVTKVSTRVRQIVMARNAPGLPADQRVILEETLSKELEEMRNLFGIIVDMVVGVAEGSNDAMAEGREGEGDALQVWGEKWGRVFRRKLAVEDSWVGEMIAVGDGVREAEEENGIVEEVAMGEAGVGTAGEEGVAEAGARNGGGDVNGNGREARAGKKRKLVEEEEEDMVVDIL